MGTVPATAPAPADHLGKRPRRAVVGIYLDDELAVVWEQASAVLEQRKLTSDNDRIRRVAAGKSRVGADLPTLPVEERLRLSNEVADEVEASLAGDLEPLAAAVDEALAALDAGTCWFTFRALGRKRWKALVKEHRPSDADHAELAEQTGNADARAPWNAETLAPVLLLQSSAGRLLNGEHLGPLGKADVDAIFEGDAWNDSEIQALFVTALNAQLQARAVQHRPAPTST